MTELIVPLRTRRATTHLGRALARGLSPGDLVILSGPLGSGKTFLARALCRTLGLPRSVPVTSPTFSLVHEYPTAPPVVHADLYRLEREGDVASLGLLEQREGGAALLVEWGEPFAAVLGGDALIVTLNLTPRSATVRATGLISEARLGGLL